MMVKFDNRRRTNNYYSLVTLPLFISKARETNITFEKNQTFKKDQTAQAGTGRPACGLLASSA